MTDYARRSATASRLATAAAATSVASAVAALLLTACGTEVDDCGTQPMFYSTTDHLYHYGSPTGRTVPATKVPSGARKVPGYKPYNPPKPAPKVNGPAPRPAAPPKAPSSWKH